jgi:uncharacterized oxidoreductase
MNTSGNTILITGGTSGIGLALAEACIKAGNQVIICGRGEERLQKAVKKLPGLHAKKCDISRAEERSALFEWAAANYPGLNVLVNNAGIQRQIDFLKGAHELLDGEDEIETNFRAPIHLSALFIPHFERQKQAAIVNISSGLGFIPIAILPVYCATKAATHSFSVSLRHQLRQTSIKVFEIIPPTVDTELDKGARDRRGQAEHGIQPGEVAEATLDALRRDQYETAVAGAQFLYLGARRDPEGVFNTINSH